MRRREKEKESQELYRTRMPKRKRLEEVVCTTKSPFHLPGGQSNPACVPAQPPPRGWRIDWTAGTAEQAWSSTPTLCFLCKRQFPDLLICYGGFCHYRFVCPDCSIPTQRLACYKCRHSCKREPGCHHLATMTTRVTCIKCWQVNEHYEDTWEIEQVQWFWHEIEKQGI